MTKVLKRPPSASVLQRHHDQLPSCGAHGQLSDPS